jgi:hypothetical protein
VILVQGDRRRTPQQASEQTDREEDERDRHAAVEALPVREEFVLACCRLLRDDDVAHAAVRDYAMPRLAAILWRYLEAHEECIARASGTDIFDVVTAVPSSTPERDEARGLRTIVGWCDPVNDRYERVLRATGEAPPGRAYNEDRYMVTRGMDRERVLLVDDTWAAGGHAQSAGYSLRVAGAATVALVVIGRHLNPEWEVTRGVFSAELFSELPPVFDWASCTVH